MSILMAGIGRTVKCVLPAEEMLVLVDSVKFVGRAGPRSIRSSLSAAVPSYSLLSRPINSNFNGISNAFLRKMKREGI